MVTRGFEGGGVHSEQLVIVSGKGGVGKSAIASAIALETATAARTALVTLETHELQHPFFGVPLRYEPTFVADRLCVLRIDAFMAVREYARRKMPFSALYEGFLAGRMFRDFAEAAPGFEELMCLGKISSRVGSSTRSSSMRRRRAI